MDIETSSRRVRWRSTVPSEQRSSTTRAAWRAAPLAEGAVPQPRARRGRQHRGHPGEVADDRSRWTSRRHRGHPHHARQAVPPHPAAAYAALLGALPLPRPGPGEGQPRSGAPRTATHRELTGLLRAVTEWRAPASVRVWTPEPPYLRDSIGDSDVATCRGGDEPEWRTTLTLVRPRRARVFSDFPRSSRRCAARWRGRPRASTSSDVPAACSACTAGRS